MWQLHGSIHFWKNSQNTPSVHEWLLTFDIAHVYWYISLLRVYLNTHAFWPVCDLHKSCTFSTEELDRDFSTSWCSIGVNLQVVVNHIPYYRLLLTKEFKFIKLSAFLKHVCILHELHGSFTTRVQFALGPAGSFSVHCATLAFKHKQL